MVIGSDMGEKQNIKYRDYLQHISVLCSRGCNLNCVKACS